MGARQVGWCLACTRGVQLVWKNCVGMLGGKGATWSLDKDWEARKPLPSLCCSWWMREHPTCVLGLPGVWRGVQRGWVLGAGWRGKTMVN